MPHRLMFTLSAVLAALVLAAMPGRALASDDCDDEDDCDTPPAAVVTPAPPVPAPAPVQVLPTTPSGGAPAPVMPVSGKRVRSTIRSEHRTRTTKRTTTTKPVVRVRHAAFVAQTIPRGGVQAGAGGTAPAGPDELAFALAGGSLLLLSAGGGLLARARRARRAPPPRPPRAPVRSPLTSWGRQERRRTAALLGFAAVTGGVGLAAFA